MSKKKMAFILWTNGLEYDDRIRKEIRTIQSVSDIDITIFAVHGDNREESGMMSYGIPYHIVSLESRNKYKKGTLAMLMKEKEMYSKIKKLVKDFDYLWVIDDQPFLFPLLSNKKMIWDLHEIPALITGSKLKETIFHRMEKRCATLIHANNERLDYLTEKGIIRRKEKHHILRNYPDKEWMQYAQQEFDEFKKFKQWLADDEYIYIQGVNNPSRYPTETLSAVLESKAIKAVVLGNFSKEIKEQLKQKYSHFDEYIYFAGQVSQEKTAPFIANCKFTIVLYSTDVANNRYCEPNRLFQCLAFGKPAIVGNNEPLVNVIKKDNLGVVMDTDGRSLSDNKEAIGTIMANYTKYKKCADGCASQFLWESQTNVIKQVLAYIE